MRYIKYLNWFLLSLVLLYTNVQAASSPVSLLQGISDQMISQLRSHKAELKTHPAFIHSLVKKIMLPYVDMDVVARGVLGSYWAKASASERSEFVSRFTSMVINTYAQALAAYSDETVRYLPLRENAAGKTSIKVDSIIVRSSGPTIPVSYRLINRSGQWRIYDMIVDNISLVQNYRSQFSSVLRSQGGVSGLLKTMAAHSH